MRRPRIGYYVVSTAMGGIERHVLSLIDHLSDTSDITVFCENGSRSTRFLDELGKRPVQVVPVVRRRMNDRPGNWRLTHYAVCGVRWVSGHVLGAYLKGFIRTIREVPAIMSARSSLAAAKLDVIHFHASSIADLYQPLIGAAMSRIRTRLLTVHTTPAAVAPDERILQWCALKNLDVVTAASEHLRRRLITDRGISAHLIQVVFNGIAKLPPNAQVERAKARQELGISEDVPVVGMVTRLKRVKGVDLLLHAAPLLRAQFPNLKVVVVGEGPEETDFRELAKHLGIEDMIIFAGYHSFPMFLIPAFDVLAVPSREEGFSYVALEAMACSKPVVATSVGGLPEIVCHGVTGYLVPPENAAAIAAALIDLSNDRDKAEKMGRAGLERARTRFCEDETLAEYVSLYGLPPPESTELDKALRRYSFTPEL